MLVGASGLAATAVAVLVGVFAVSTVGATIRDRGPLGNEVLRNAAEIEPTAGPSPTRTPAVRDEVIDEEFGRVRRRVPRHVGVRRRRAPRHGGRLAGRQLREGSRRRRGRGLQRRPRSVELEVFCNRGRPTVAELERNTLGDD